MPPSSTGNGIHHPRFGYYLKERMDKLGIECVVKVKNDYDEKPAGQPGDDIVDFLAGHLQHPEGLCKPEDRFWQVRL